MLPLLAYATASAFLRLTTAESIALPISSYAIAETKTPLATYYGSTPVVFSPNITGLYTYQLPGLQTVVSTTGDIKSVTTLYGEDDDYVVTLIIEESLLTVTNIRNRRTSHLKLWGDYSAVCAVGSSLVYIFGKGEVKVVLVERGKLREVSDVPVPVEAEACAATTAGTIFFGGNDGIVYSLDGNSIQPSSTIVKTPITVYDEIAGLAVYEGKKKKSDYLFVSVQPGTVEVFSTSSYKNLYSITLTEEDTELEGIAVYQKPLNGYKKGALLISFDEDPGPKGTGIVSLSKLDLSFDTNFNPRKSERNPRPSNRCSNNGFQISSSSRCLCFTGYTGAQCSRQVCLNNCSSRGTCAGPNTCQCNSGWTGPDCSFSIITASYETSANGGDGDDPAIWIHPSDRSKSRIITTTKSKEGAGFALFDLKGEILSQLPAGEPNNVDVIYNFAREDGRVVDLAVAACRDEDTLCLAEVTEDSLTSLVDLPIKNKFKVYGSCVYHSPLTGKHYIFVNSKTAEYLQYELTPSLEAVLVRSFIGGSGGQVEGCVVDEENGWIFVGEEPYGLWRYSAEPDGGDAHVLVDSIEGNLFPDVEGVTLVYGPSKDQGLIIVSCQGVSAYNIYRRGGNHEFVGRFTIQAGSVDRVTNTDGVAAVGTNLRLPGFEGGVLVVHDDVNSAPDGSRDVGASFKIVHLGDILKQFNLSGEVDSDWDPRK